MMPYAADTAARLLMTGAAIGALTLGLVTALGDETPAPPTEPALCECPDADTLQAERVAMRLAAVVLWERSRSIDDLPELMGYIRRQPNTAEARELARVMRLLEDDL